MKYDFDTLSDRTDTASLKWDVKEGELPMWVADMDFATAPEIVEALQKRVEHKIFGYSTVPISFYKHIQRWWIQQHQMHFETSWMMFCTGVVPAISSIIRHVTNIGDNVLIQSPVYNIFYNSIVNNGRHVLSSDLKYVNGQYEIDFHDLERKLSNSQTTLMILCNPHNPIGKVWDKETLVRIGALCVKHHVLVVSDEVHCDLVSIKTSYTPFASASLENQQNCITCVAPSKAFNLAGLQTSCIIISNEQLRHKVYRGIQSDEVGEPNSFAISASNAAFEKGKDWLVELCEYIDSNKKEVQSYIQEKLPELHVVESEATYLLWIDCTKICEDDVSLVEHIRKQTGLYLSYGSMFGENGKGFLRMNIACPKIRLNEGLQRLRAGIESYKASTFL
ncbi:MalY/PatB family protein [Amedibacillus sp. YH-ame6]